MQTNSTLEGIQSVLSLIDREVWIITSAAAGRRGGLCATWVSAAAIDPGQPIILVGLAPNHFTTELIEQSGMFGLHLLRPEQTGLALDFAIGSGRDRDKLANVALRPSHNAIPLMSDCLAWLECRVFARYHAGDRIFYWANLLHGDCPSAGVPLREKQLFAAANAEQKQALLLNRSVDIALHAPLHLQWKTENLWSPEK
jgi:flavin reductase (DIM6/NTAB) family NADH-FMN oxidoreductase RutF